MYHGAVYIGCVPCHHIILATSRPRAGSIALKQTFIMYCWAGQLQPNPHQNLLRRLQEYKTQQRRAQPNPHKIHCRDCHNVMSLIVEHKRAHSRCGRWSGIRTQTRIDCEIQSDERTRVCSYCGSSFGKIRIILVFFILIFWSVFLDFENNKILDGLYICTTYNVKIFICLHLKQIKIYNHIIDQYNYLSDNHHKINVCLEYRTFIKIFSK